MLVFIDESGDPGLKIESGSSSVFVLAMVIFKENEDAHLADREISALKESLRIGRKAEFKFNKMSNQLRSEFLVRASAFNFQYFGIVINKAKLYGEGFKYKESFYKYTCKLIFENAKHLLKDATVVIDGNGDWEFQKQLGAYLKSQINSQTVSHVKKVKMEQSHANNLLQLADMVSGSIYRSHKKDREDHTFRNLIRRREIHVQVWPK